MKIRTTLDYEKKQVLNEIITDGKVFEIQYNLPQMIRNIEAIAKSYMITSMLRGFGISIRVKRV